jgi:DNA (cytosine-5)-methyltransferase 1
MTDSQKHYYNDIEPSACTWMQRLMDARLIPEGIIDGRSIADVRPEELEGYRQCHFFSGIAGWPRALELAGWPSDVECWSGSAPCQPFSCAGKRKGEKDERHLWPEFRRLIEARRPAFIFGEQVASSDVIGTELEASFVIAVQSGDYAKANKLAKRLVKSNGFHYWTRWVDGIQTDLETLGYAFGFKVLGAHSVCAPHIRQRLYWGAVRVDESSGIRDWRGTGHRSCEKAEAQGRRTQDAGIDETWNASTVGGVGNAKSNEQRRDTVSAMHGQGQQAGRSGDFGWMEKSRREQQRRGLLGPKESIESVGFGTSDQSERSGDFSGMADTLPTGRSSRRTSAGGGQASCGSSSCRLADMQQQGLEGHAWDGNNGYESGRIGAKEAGSVAESCHVSGLADADSPEFCEQSPTGKQSINKYNSRSGFWSTCRLIHCQDNKVRRVPNEAAFKSDFQRLLAGISSDLGLGDGEEMTMFPLAEKLPNHVALLRGVGNSINPYVAAEFIKSFMEVLVIGIKDGV